MDFEQQLPIIQHLKLTKPLAMASSVRPRDDATHRQSAAMSTVEVPHRREASASCTATTVVDLQSNNIGITQSDEVGVVTKAKVVTIIQHDPSAETEESSQGAPWAAARTDPDSSSSRESRILVGMMMTMHKWWRRHCGLVITLIAVLSCLVIILASLGATGHLHNSQQAQVGGSGVDVDGSHVGEMDNVDGNNGTGMDGTETSPPPSVPDNTNNNGNDGEDTDTSPTPSPPLPVTYVPGLLTVEENGLLLSQGLTSRIIAQRRRRVEYANGELSIEPFHRRPDYGATFPCHKIVQLRTREAGSMLAIRN